jgi:hypothetical protein
MASYAATVTLTLKNGEREDYDAVYEHLESIGLSRKIKGENEHTLPETTLYGTFEANSAASLRDYISTESDKAYSLAGVSGKVFITTRGTDHTWGIRYPKGA